MSSKTSVVTDPTPVAIVSAGEMGAGLAGRLVQSGVRVLTHLEGRSDATRRRAAAAGMEEASLAKIARDAKWVLSVLPPAAAEKFADDFIAAFQSNGAVPSLPDGGSRTPVFVDCNAKNPETARNIGQRFAGTPIVFLDACILGLPPDDKGHDPTIYASTSPHHDGILVEFSQLQHFGLKVKLIDEPGSDIGDASAMKMAYSGIMKGMVGIYETMLLAAHAHKPAIAQAVIKEMNKSLPSDLRNVIFYVPNTFGKSYRFVREMHEMEAFVRSTLQERGMPDSSDISRIYAGLSSTYQHIADSVAGRDDGEAAIKILQGFVAQGLELVRNSSP